MKYLKKLSEMRIFNHEDLTELTGDVNLTNGIIRNYINKKYITRITRDMYAVISLETNGIIPSKYEIASNITKSSFVSHHSAFEFYGYYNQVYNQIIVSSLTRFQNFQHQEISYEYKNTKDDEFTERIRGVKISSIARTIVDSIEQINSYDEFIETIKCIQMLPAINGLHIMKYLLHRNKQILFSKVGLVLSNFKDDLLITDTLLWRMKNLGTKGRRYFTKETYRLTTFYNEWNLYCYNTDELFGDNENV